MPFYEFGPFRIDTVERLLTRDGAPVPLTPKAFETLLTLVENSRHVIVKDDLMKRVWPDTCVEEANLTQNIFILRRVLDEEHGGRNYIETVPRRGYRFVASVKEIGNEDKGLPAAAQDRESVVVEREQAETTRRAIAVLPFINNSDDPNLEYLSDGITESIINNLSQLPALKVMARSTVFRYKGREIGAPEIGRELGVRAVLMGRVLQLSDSLTISVELVDATDGSQLWGKRYTLSFSDIFVAQEEIVQEVTQNLQLKSEVGEQGRSISQYRRNIDAYHAYLKGRYCWNKYTLEGIKKGIECFRQAINHDPHYALAHAGLADSYLRLSNTYLPPREMLPQAKVSALCAVSIDEGLAEAHSSLGAVKLYYDYDWTGAESEYRRAIRLAPGTVLAYGRLGILLLLKGRFDDAMVELEKAQELDPLSLQLLLSISTNLYFMGLTREAVQQAQKVLDIEPHYYPAYITLSWIYMQTGEPAKAIATLEEALRLEKHPIALAYMGCAYAITGERSKAQGVLKELENKLKDQYISPYHMAVIYAGLGEKEQAFDWLEKLYEQQNDWLVWLKVSPELRPLRSDQKYKDLLQRIGLA